MKHLLSALILALLHTATLAQTEAPSTPRPGMGMGPGMGSGMGPGMGMRAGGPPQDCSKAPDPANCKAMQAAHEACKEHQGMARRECMEEKMPAPDCSKSPQPDQCRKHQAAHQACKDKPFGQPRHDCVMEKMGNARPPKPQ